MRPGACSHWPWCWTGATGRMRTQALIQKTIPASLSRAKSAIERLEMDGVVSWRVCQAA